MPRALSNRPRWRRGIAALLAAMLAVAAPARLRAQSGGDGPDGLTLGGSSGQPGAQTCVQVEIAGEKPSTYNCLNQELQQQAQGASPLGASPPLAANSPSNQVGTFNEQSVSEQYGQNFGKSSIPYRPPAPNFGNGVTPH